MLRHLSVASCCRVGPRALLLLLVLFIFAIVIVARCLFPHRAVAIVVAFTAGRNAVAPSLDVALRQPQPQPPSQTSLQTNHVAYLPTSTHFATNQTGIMAPSHGENTGGKAKLTLETLAQYDDLITDALVDKVGDAIGIARRN